MPEPSSQPAAPLVLAVIPDLFFATKVTECARHLDVVVRVVPRVTDLLVAWRADEPPPHVALLDMGSLGAQVAEAIAVVRGRWGRGTRIVAFGSHVDREAFADAAAQGADAVLPRSTFVALLPQILRGEA